MNCLHAVREARRLEAIRRAVQARHPSARYLVTDFPLAVICRDLFPDDEQAINVAYPDTPKDTIE